MLEPPEKIGPYRILRKLGEGGMGAVFEGIHELIERHVAIKVLHTEFAQRPEFVARFFNEAREPKHRLNHRQRTGDREGPGMGQETIFPGTPVVGLVRGAKRLIVVPIDLGAQ